MEMKVYGSSSYADKYPADIVESYIKKMKNHECKTAFWGTGLLGTGYGYHELKKRGIMPDFYCDNNKDKWGKIIIDDIECYDIDKIKANSETCIYVLTVAFSTVPDVVEQLRSMGIRHIIPYDVLHRHLHIGWEYFDFITDDRIVAYTCVVGDYDDIVEPKFCSDIYDYYLISDKPPVEGSKYKWVDIKNVIPEDVVGDYTRMNRYCKINAHRIFPDYRRSIYYDGNVEIVEDMTSFFDYLLAPRIGVTARNIWGDIYEEAMTVIEQRRDLPEKVYDQVKGYWLEGFPRGGGMGLNNILVREHNHPQCVKIMEQWWTEVKTKCRRDQISFPYVLWKNGYSLDDILFLTDNYNRDKHWIFHNEHNVSRLHDLKKYMAEQEGKT